MKKPPPEIRTRAYARGFGGFLRGLSYPFRGLHFLVKNPSLWAKALFPALLILTLVALAVTGSFSFHEDITDVLLPDRWDTGESWGRIAAWAASFISGLLCLLLGTLVGFAGSMPLVGPLNELLAESVERTYGGKPTEESNWSFKVLLTDLLRALSTSIQRLFIFGVLYLPLLLLSFIPFVGPVFTALLLLYSAYFLTLTFIEPCQDIRRMSLRDKVRWSKETLPAYLGFGGASVALLLIPCAGFLLAPFLVTGATLLWVDVGGIDRDAASPVQSPPEIDSAPAHPQ
jgi:CysZ protein